MKKSILLPLYLCSLAFLPLGATKPISAQQASCQSTVNSVLKDISNRGTGVRYEINRDYEHGAFLNSILGNTNRINGISFSLNANRSSGRPASVSANILHSGVLMKSYSSQIFSVCGGTGSVNFAEASTDWIVSFGMRDDGVLGFEDCSFSSSDIRQAISKIHGSQYSMDGYCAYVVPDF